MSPGPAEAVPSEVPGYPCANRDCTSALRSGAPFVCSERCRIIVNERKAQEAAEARHHDQEHPRSLVKACLVVDDVRAIFAGNPSLRGRMRVFVQVEVDGVGSSEPLREIKIGRDAAGEPILVLVVDQ
jgi:hypothetical protein